MATDREKLDRLLDAMCDDIMAMSEEELRAELIEDGEDPDEVIARMKAIVDKALARARQASRERE